MDNQQNKWDSKYKTVEKDLKNTNKQKKLDQTKYQNAKYRC